MFLQIANSLDLYCIIKTTDFISNQSNDAYCNKLASQVDKSCSVYLLARYGILVWQSKVDDDKQNFVPASLLCPCFPSIALSGLSWSLERTTFIWYVFKEFYWPHMANEFFSAVLAAIVCCIGHSAQSRKRTTIVFSVGPAGVHGNGPAPSTA